MKSITLKEKYILITGASSGIGKEFSRILAAEGAHLLLGSHPDEETMLKEWIESLTKKYGITAWPLCYDLSDPDGPIDLYRNAKENTPHIDILINNAGIIKYGPFWESPWSIHDKIISVNAKAYTAIMNLFLPDMIQRGKGRIFNICSVSAFQPSPHHAVYGATKSFIQSLSDALGEELKRTGVTISTFNPSYTDTPLLQGNGFPNKLRWFSLGGLKSPAWVAEKGVTALKKGTRLSVPGLRNKIIHLFLPRILPRFLIWKISDLVLRSQ